MKQLSIIYILIFALLSCQPKLENKIEKESINFKTFCNPIDISYRFCIDTPSRREAADPTIIKVKDKYFLFASKSEGYWYSSDLVSWTFIQTTQIPVEEYAPTVIELSDTLYFLASSNEKSTIYKSGDPLSGTWTIAVEKLEMPVWDPSFLLDDDNRLYLYWGCSNKNPIYGVEIDYKNNFKFIGKPKELIFANPKEHGWEVPGDYNTLTQQAPWIEGAWMSKINGKYYLQYSGPGTEYKGYCDGVYVSDSPLGTFSLQPSNPFAYKPEGYAAGAGHGSTFTDKFENLWHIGTITISQKHMFERRLGLYPVFCDHEGTLYSSTKYGDYPHIIPYGTIKAFDDIFPGWMLLSYKKNVTVSSSIDSFPDKNITDENIRTYWSANSGDSTEFVTLDLGELYDVYAIQVNFAEHNTKIFGRSKALYHKYLIEYSINGDSWDILIDKSKNETDNTHNYFQLENKISCKYLKIKNIAIPSGNFAISGFRVFGKGSGDKPQKINTLTAKRNNTDKRSVNLVWEKSKNAIGYNISYGIDKTKLYQNYLVYTDTVLTINSLNTNYDYYFTIESFNENGISTSDLLIKAE